MCSTNFELRFIPGRSRMGLIGNWQGRKGMLPIGKIFQRLRKWSPECNAVKFDCLAGSLSVYHHESSHLDSERPAVAGVRRFHA